MQPYAYKAFVSYSWADAKWGKWAHGAIESYRTPKSLVGRDTALGPVPRSLHPLFKDREEEAAGASIGAAVEAALASSEFLLVICSPSSARSQWVNYEIAWFKTHRDPAKILALIVDGEPGASGIPGRENEECFPRALTHKVDANLQITDAEEDTPLAADARPSGDGKQAAKLKIVAAMLGVKLDELVRRDQKRRALRGRIAIAASLSIAVMMSAMAWFATQARNEARVQRDQAEGLVEFMISDLREKLQPNVQLEVLGGIADRANKYYKVQSNFSMDANALGRRSRVLKLLAELEQDRGNTVVAVQLLRQSVDASARQLAFAPDNPQRILEHANNAQGLGEAAYAQGDLKLAFAQMDSAVGLLRSLVERKDATDEWKAEYGSALANLGIVNLQQRRIDAAARYLGQATRIKRNAAGRADAEWQDKFDLAITLAWMARAQAAAGKDAPAAKLLDEESNIYTQMLSDDPDDTYALAARVANRTKRAEGLRLTGKLRKALATATEASADAQRSLKFDPGDMTNVDRFARSQIVLARINFDLGNQSSALGAVRKVITNAERLAKHDPSRIAWSGDLLGNARTLAIQIAARGANSRGSCLAALRPIASEADRLAKLSRKNPRDLDVALAAIRAATVLGDFHSLRGQGNDARRSWSDARTLLLKFQTGARPPSDLSSKEVMKALDRREKRGQTSSETADMVCGR